MRIENWFKSKKPRAAAERAGEMDREDAVGAAQTVAALGAAATIGLAGGYAAAGEVAHGPDAIGNVAPHEMQLNPSEQDALYERGPGGAKVTIDHESGQATVHIPHSGDKS